ncbi:MAG: hypothetical protein Q8N08_09775 [Methanobacteriaceae archaeon]|nr:hypothetical protein [Methanobacteriaceae archaeon]
MLVLLAVIIFEVVQSRFSIQLAIGGISIGLVVGIIVSRTYHLSWDEETNKVIGQIDWIGAVILVSYLIFVFTKTDVVGYWKEGTSLFAIIIGITAGTMLGRVLGTKRGINKILEALKI